MGEALLPEPWLRCKAGSVPVAFPMRHVAPSMDRLLTYADCSQLSREQIAALKTELDPGAGRDEVFAEFTSALAAGADSGP